MKYLLIVCFLLIPTVFFAEEVNFIVMTYNIGGATTLPLDEPQIMQIANEIKSASADVVGMCEVDIATRRRDGRNLKEEIRVALENIGYPMEVYGASSWLVDRGYQEECLYSRHPIIETGFYVTIDGADYGYPDLGRMVNVRIAVEPVPGAVIQVFETHYYIGDADQYQVQTDNNLYYLSQYINDYPIIQTGDLNFNPQSTYYQQFIDLGLQDPCKIISEAFCLTVGGGANINPPLHEAQIDYVLGNDKVNFTGVYMPSTTVSDHWPLVAEMKILYTPAPPTATPTKTPTEVIKPWLQGDVNCDTAITPADALLAFQIYLGTYIPEDTAECNIINAADYDDNGGITPADALCIFQAYLGNFCL